MKGVYTKENSVWCIKIYSNRFDKKSIEKMHKLLDDGITEVREVKNLEKRVAKMVRK